MRRQLLPAVVSFLAFTVLTGLAYPLAVTGVAQVAFPERADGSLIEQDGEVVGSRLIGQAFSGPRYFHPRPSAAGDGYDGMASAPSNLGPTNEELLAAVDERTAAYRRENSVDADQRVPVERARGLALDDVLTLVDEHTTGRSLGFLGEPGVNVLELNLALDGGRR
jgi:K+-transporting ATPase ATPase C chain